MSEKKITLSNIDLVKLFGANVEPIPDTYRNKGREKVAENIVKVSAEKIQCAQGEAPFTKIQFSEIEELS